MIAILAKLPVEEATLTRLVLVTLHGSRQHSSAPHVSPGLPLFANASLDILERLIIRATSLKAQVGLHADSKCLLSLDSSY